MKKASRTRARQAARVVSTMALLIAAMAVVAISREARAQPPDPELLARLSHHAEAFEEIMRRASFRYAKTMNQLDGDGKIVETDMEAAHVERDGTTTQVTTDRCVENGKDVTAERRKEEEEEAAARRKEKAETNAKKEQGKDSGDSFGLRMPFLESEQPLYVFDQTQVDPANPSRVEISFTPRKPDKHTVQGAAWVDTTTGTVLTAGVKLSKPPMFIDYVHFTLEFGEKTTLGPALSRATFDAKGGFLFIHKHLRGEAVISEYRIAP